MRHVVVMRNNLRSVVALPDESLARAFHMSLEMRDKCF
jgi:hypothetical protein